MPTPEPNPTAPAAPSEDAALAAALIGLALRIAENDISTDDGQDVEHLANGDVRKWIPLAEAGEKWLNGPDEFDMTPALIDEGIANWKADGSNPMPITLGHTWDPAAPAVAWIEDLERRDDNRPWGQVRFLADTWASIQRGEYKYFSLEFYKKKNDRKGQPLGFCFDGGAIVNKPFFPIRIDQARHEGASSPCFALHRFNSSTGTAGDPPAPIPTPAAALPTAPGGSPMPESNPNPPATPAAPAPVVSGDKVTLSKAQFDGLIALQAENARLKLENAALTADKATLDGRIGSLERSRTAERIRVACSKLQGQGIVLQLGDFAIDASENDAIAWLATQPYGVSTVEGLEKLAKDQEATAHLPRVKLGGERSGGGNSVPSAPEDLTTEAGRKAALQNRIAQIRRTFRKDELDITLARRHQSLEQLAREDLAADFPEYRKELLAGK
jgi:Mu-like prophage I protein